MDGHQLSFRPPSKAAYTYSFVPSSNKNSIRYTTTEYSTPAFERSSHASCRSVNIAKVTTTSSTKRVMPYYSHQQYQKAAEEPDHYTVVTTPLVTIRTESNLVRMSAFLTINIVPNSKVPNTTARVLPFKNPYTTTSKLKNEWVLKKYQNLVR